MDDILTIDIRGKRCEKVTGDFRSQMRGVSVNDNDSDDDYGDILSREMKSRAFGEGLIINCSSSCSNREIKSEGD